MILYKHKSYAIWLGYQDGHCVYWQGVTGRSETGRTRASRRVLAGYRSEGKVRASVNWERLE